MGGRGPTNRQQLGWLEVQDAARRMTCKGLTQRDYILLSPEAITRLQDVWVQGDFAEDSSVIAGLKIDWGIGYTQSWPLPATIALGARPSGPGYRLPSAQPSR